MLLFPAACANSSTPRTFNVAPCFSRSPYPSPSPSLSRWACAGQMRLRWPVFIKEETMARGFHEEVPHHRSGRGTPGAPESIQGELKIGS